MRYTLIEIFVFLYIKIKTLPLCHFDPEINERKNYVFVTKFTRLVRSVHYYDQFSYIFLTFEFILNVYHIHFVDF